MDIIIADYAEYGDGRTGYVIELDGIGLVDWTERGMGELDGPFPTPADALAAVEASWPYGLGYVSSVKRGSTP